MTDISNNTPLRPERFDAYEVSPEVEITAPDGEMGCEAFHSLKDAQQYIDGPFADGTFRILWTLYGRRKGIVEAIADCDTEVHAFALLYSIAGIQGVSGQKIYPVPYFTHVWTVFSDTDDDRETKVYASEMEAYWDALQRLEDGEENVRARELFNAENFGELNDYLQNNLGPSPLYSLEVTSHPLHF